MLHDPVAVLGGVKNKYDATVDPTPSNDSSQGYSWGSRWLNRTSGEVFTCVNPAVGAAVWVSETDEAILVNANRNMTADVTTGDGDRATATSMAHSPEGYVEVKVNGGLAKLADGQSQKPTSECYFSDDGGGAAKLIANIAAGDLLYWNGSVAGYQLSAADRIDFLYEV